MARYCANDSCRMSTHPLLPHGGPCPECGSAQYRLDPDVGTVVCSACQTANEASDRTCWSCGTALTHRRIVD